MGASLRANPASLPMWWFVPDSGVTAALGYAEEAGIPFRFGLIRNHYVGRTFIEPEQRVRDSACASSSTRCTICWTASAVILIDDSIIRGTTAENRAHGAGAGAKECICASAARRPFRRASTEWIRRASAS